MDDLQPFIEPNEYVDSDHPAVVHFAQETGGGLPPRDAAIALYYDVRDRLRYNPWRVQLTPEAYKASSILARDPDEGGHCIDKALLLAAGARALGIPSRMRYANVRNHIGTQKLEEVLGTDLMVFHGYVELRLDHRWVAATPAFNKELCRYFGVAPLEFDGVNDSIFQQLDRRGNRFMEYVTDHGAFAGVPFQLMLSEWAKHYPALTKRGVWPERPASTPKLG